LSRHCKAAFHSRRSNPVLINAVTNKELYDFILSWIAAARPYAGLAMTTKKTNCFPDFAMTVNAAPAMTAKDRSPKRATAAPRADRARWGYHLRLRLQTKIRARGRGCP
jgi:hypothetical protein